MKKIMAIIGGAMIMLFLGLIYAWSIFVAPLETEFGWTRDQTSLTFTICMSFFCIGLLLASQFRKKFSVSIILLINGIVILTAFILTANLTFLWQLYVFYGVFCGFSVGCAYNCILSVVPLYSPNRIGLINGVMLFAFGMGGFILGAIAKKIMNSYDWRITFVCLGIVLFIVILVFCFFIRLPMQQENVQGDHAKLTADTGMTPLEMFKHPYFYLFFIWQTFVNALGLALIGHAAPIANEINVPGSMIAVTVGVLTASVGIGKFCFGVLYDYKGRWITMSLASLSGVFGMLILMICISTNSFQLLLIGYFCCGIAFGSGPACNAVFTRKLFGNKHFSTNFGINSFPLLIAAFVGTYLIGIVRESSGNYTSSFIILGIYMVVSFLIVQFMRKDRV